MDPKHEMRAPKGGARAGLENRPRARSATLTREEDGELGDELSVDLCAGSDVPTSRALEVIQGRDPNDARYETRDDPRIPAGKTYFKIGEVSEITGLKPYVLRYWEDEFPWIKPEKTRSRQRRYRRQDVALLLEISRLRYEEQQTIETARQTIRERRSRERAPRAKAASGQPSSAARARLEGRSARPPTAVVRALSEMRKTVLELLEAVEE